MNSTVPEGMSHIKKYPPELLVWWKNKNGTAVDIADIYKLNNLDKQGLLQLIAYQTTRGISVLKKLGFNPMVGGSWGNGTTAECQAEGLTRGGPTNRFGHLLVGDYEASQTAPILFKKLDPKTWLNRCAPWVTDFQNFFGEEMAHIVDTHASEYLEKKVGTRSNLYRQDVAKPQNGLAVLDGYSIEFDEAIPLVESFGVLSEIGGKFEQYYQTMKELYQQHYCGEADAVHKMRELTHNFGFSPSKTAEVVDYILSIKPTYTQLNSWKEIAQESQAIRSIEQLMGKYRNFNQMVKDRGGSKNVRTELLYDMTREASEFKDITMTWPVHSSFCFTIDYSDVNQGELAVPSLKLYPLIVTTESANERSIGGVLKRALPKI